MVNKENLRNYIKKELKKGFALEDIKKKLVSAGYRQSFVDSEASRFAREGKPKSLKIAAIVILLFVLLLVVVTFFVLKPGECAPGESQCIFDTAVSARNIELCMGITDLSLKERCEARIPALIAEPRIKEAVEKKDYSLCAKAGDINSIERCQLYFFDYSINYCRCSTPNQDPDPNCSNSCQFISALDFGDSAQCDTLGTLELRETCFFYYASKLKDDSICEQIVAGKFMKKHCLAVAMGDTSVCDSLDEIYKNTCLAYVLNDGEYCSQLGERKSNCYSSLKSLNFYTGRMKYLGVET